MYWDYIHYSDERIPYLKTTGLVQHLHFTDKESVYPCTSMYISTSTMISTQSANDQYLFTKLVNDQHKKKNSKITPFLSTVNILNLATI